MDLVDRLRNFDDGPAGRGWKLCAEAADEIERLRVVRDSLVSEIEAIIGDINAAVQAPDPKPHLNLILNAHRI